MTAMTIDSPLRRRPADRPEPRAAAPAPSSPVRLTRRGRLLLLLVLAALLLVAFSLGRTSAAAGSRRVGPPPTTVVQPGETLWTIAQRVAPAADPRATVQRLTDLNDLGSSPIVAGQRLVLPR